MYDSVASTVKMAVTSLAAVSSTTQLTKVELFTWTSTQISASI